MTLHTIVAALLSFWLAFGPTMSTVAQAADTPCESMNTTVPADDCCGNEMGQAKCMQACLSLLTAMAAGSRQGLANREASGVASPFPSRHVSFLAPPDITPPRSSAS